MLHVESGSYFILCYLLYITFYYGLYFRYELPNNNNDLPVTSVLSIIHF